MRKLSAGNVIAVPCQVRPGPFSGELLISVNTVNGSISGFVRERDLSLSNTGDWFVPALVLKVRDNVVDVQIRGSLFTKNGRAAITRDMALAA
jgi:hypothetical protein